MGGGDARIDAELAVDTLQVVAGGVLADVESDGDLGVGVALPKEVEHLGLAAGESECAERLWLAAEERANRDRIEVSLRAVQVARLQFALGSVKPQRGGSARPSAPLQTAPAPQRIDRRGFG